ncbi:MAG: helix-turn-helix domain-containing protein [Planctomycetes bacterium]|nr:helix-turn-helix domain-containing protein [Planctomycetota bacterium]
MDPLENLGSLVRDAIASAITELRSDVDQRLEEFAVHLEMGLDRRLTVAEACEYYRIGRSTFDRLHADPDSGLREVVLRFGRRIVVPERAFEQWLRSRSPRPRRKRAR